MKLGTCPNTQEAAEGNTEPKEPEDLGGNVDLKQLGLSLKPGGGKDGVVIADVDPNSDAASKGLKEGDVILKAGEQSVATPQDVVKAVQKSKDLGLPAVMLHIKKGDQTVLVAIPIGKS